MSIPVYKNERKEPMSGMTSGKEPRYKYTSPSIKPQSGKPPELGTDINEYSLTICDVQTERRNFPGYGETQYVTIEDLQDKVGDTWGTTDTDSISDAKTGERSVGYSKINASLRGKQKSRWNTRSN